jgi:hypothetical protein
MKAYVIMPFGNEGTNPNYRRKQDAIYERWIKPTVEAVKSPTHPNVQIKCSRGDSSSRPGEIIVDIIENLLTADIVIADLSGRNPNVFYELGVRHALKNDTVLIAERLDDVPFDLRGQRLIVYSYDPDGMLKLKEDLENAILSILSSTGNVDNPIQRYLQNNRTQHIELESVHSDNPLIKDIFSELTSLRKELQNYSEQMQQVNHISSVLRSAKIDDFANLESDRNAVEPCMGVWFDEISRSTFYARMYDGHLLVPYCYEGNDQLVGVSYNFKRVANTFFARFKWFNQPISGFLYMEVINSDRLQGGWWYSEEIPKELLSDMTLISKDLPRMKKLLGVRRPSSGQDPAWVNSFFTSPLAKEFT